MSHYTTIQDGGRLVIPVALRRELGLKEGDSVVLSVEDGELRLSTQIQALTKLRALVNRQAKSKKTDRSAAAFIADRRKEAKRESSELRGKKNRSGKSAHALRS